MEEKMPNRRDFLKNVAGATAAAAGFALPQIGVAPGKRRELIRLQNEKISQWCAIHPDRFVGMATVAMQHPDLAADQLDEAIKKLGLRGAAIGGSVEGQELSDRKFDPFWAKAQELGVLLF